MRERKQQFTPAPEIQMIQTKDDEAILLDLQTDRFLGLDQMGTLMWKLLTAGNSPEAVVHSITERYEIEAGEELRKDVVQFIQTMEAQHLLLPLEKASVPKFQPSRRSVFHFQRDWPHMICSLIHLARFRFFLCEWLEAWLLLRWIHLFLSRGSLVDLLVRWHALPVQKTLPYENPDIRRLAAHVQSAAAWQPFNAVCLHQNLALGFMLRQRAVQAELMIGVSTYPFFAHAWLTSGIDVIHWQAGLGSGATLQRLQSLSIIFSTSVQARSGGEQWVE